MAPEPDSLIGSWPSLGKDWARLDEAAPVRWLRPLTVLGYVPLGLLPWVWMQLASDPYRPPIEKLAMLLPAFIGWFVVIFLEFLFVIWFC